MQNSPKIMPFAPSHRQLLRHEPHHIKQTNRPQEGPVAGTTQVTHSRPQPSSAPQASVPTQRLHSRPPRLLRWLVFRLPLPIARLPWSSSIILHLHYWLTHAWQCKLLVLSLMHVLLFFFFLLGKRYRRLRNWCWCWCWCWRWRFRVWFRGNG